MNKKSPVQFKLKLPFKLPLGIGGFALPWFEAYQVAKLDQKPETTGGKIAQVIVPSWYSAFKVANLTPYKGPKSEWKHTLGKILGPSVRPSLCYLRFNSDWRTQKKYGYQLLSTASTNE